MTVPRSYRFAVLLTCLGTAGCAEAMAEVSGAITLKGQAPNLKGFDIGFLGGNGRFATATINSDGTYKAVGVPVGAVMICFIYTTSDPAQLQKKGRLLRPPPDGSAAMPSPALNQHGKNPIPLHLRDGSTSKLSFTVAPGPNNVFNYDVRP